MEIALKLGGILLGVLARTLLPYLRKLKEGKITTFKKGYLVSALAAVILSLFTTLLIFPEFKITAAGQGLEGSIKLFCTAFGFGFAWNALVNETAEWKKKGQINE